MVAQKQTPRLLALYRDEIGPKLLKEFGLKNPHQLPKLSKIIRAVVIDEPKEEI